MSTARNISTTSTGANIEDPMELEPLQPQPTTESPTTDTKTFCAKVKDFFISPRSTSNLNPGDEKNFNCWTLITTVYFMLVYLKKEIFEVVLAYEYAKTAQWLYFTLTVIFIFYPSIIISTWSLIHMDWISPRGRLKRILSVLCHCTLLSPVASYIESIIYGYKSLRNGIDENKRKALESKTEAETLKRFESVMGSGPQLVLQFYIMVELASNPSQEPQEIPIRMVQVAMSVYHLALGLTTAYKMFTEKMSRLGNFILFLSNLSAVGARVIVFSLFASSKYGSYIWAIYIGHSFFMANWLEVLGTKSTQEPNDDIKQRKEEFFSRVILPFVYIFTFFKIRTDWSQLRTRISYIIFYTVMAAENIVLVVIWANQAGDNPQWFAGAAVIAQASFLVICIFFQGIYHAFLEIKPHSVESRNANEVE